MVETNNMTIKAQELYHGNPNLLSRHSLFEESQISKENCIFGKSESISKGAFNPFHNIQFQGGRSHKEFSFLNDNNCQLYNHQQNPSNLSNPYSASGPHLKNNNKNIFTTVNNNKAKNPNFKTTKESCITTINTKIQTKPEIPGLQSKKLKTNENTVSLLIGN